jgi:hypothetical protein
MTDRTRGRARRKGAELASRSGPIDGQVRRMIPSPTLWTASAHSAFADSVTRAGSPYETSPPDPASPAPGSSTWSSGAGTRRSQRSTASPRRSASRSATSSRPPAPRTRTEPPWRVVLVPMPASPDTEAAWDRALAFLDSLGDPDDGDPPDDDV